MAHLESKGLRFRIDATGGSITDISESVNSQALAQAVAILEDTAVGDSRRTNVQGVGQWSVTLNGWLDTTIENVFGPVALGTAITKTMEYMAKTGVLFYNGEVDCENYEITGPIGLQTWSVTLQGNGALNRTSTALV